MNLDQWFRRRCILKIVLIWNSGGPFAQWNGTICAILIEGIKRNNSVNYYKFEPVVQEEMPFQRFLIWNSGNPPVKWSRTICVISVEGIMRNNSLKLFKIWTSGSGRDVF